MAASLTARMRSALHMIVNAGEARVAVEARPWNGNEVANRTAWALERRGLVERVYTGRRHAHCVIPTAAGREMSDALARDVVYDCPSCGWKGLQFVAVEEDGDTSYICPDCGDEWFESTLANTGDTPAAPDLG